MHPKRALEGLASFRESVPPFRKKTGSARSIAISYNALRAERSPSERERAGRRLRLRREGALMSSPGGMQPGERTRDKLSLLRSHPLFRDLPPGVIERLGSYMKARRGPPRGGSFPQRGTAP